MTSQSAASDLDLIAECAREAGAMTRAHFGRAVKTWSKGAAGPVTEVDYAVDQFLREKLSAARPDYGWLSEESVDTDARLFKTHVWIVDPIDGTEAFLRGIAQYTISIGLSVEGRAALGAVYNPMTDELFLGGEGAPATLNGRPVRVTERTELAGAHFIGQKRTFADNRWEEHWPKLELSWRHSIAYRLALIGAGYFDATILLGYKNEWDIAAGAAIVQAAGGAVTQTGGDPIVFNSPEAHAIGVVAAGPALHPLIVERTRGVPHPSEWGDRGWRGKAKENAKS